MRSLLTARWSEIEKSCDHWLGSAQGRAAPAIVVGGSVNGLSFVRSLARRGVPTLLLDSEPLIGMYTRLATALVLPPVATEPDVWLRLLTRIGERSPRRPVLFVTTDAHMVFVGEHAESLRRTLAFAVPARDVLERIVDKRLQYEAAAAAGIPIPTTFFPGSPEEVETLAERLTYPCILKPYKSHEGRGRIKKKVLVVERSGDLAPAFAEIASPGVEFMIQEIVPGPDSELYGYLAFWDARGREALWLTKRKLRQNPPHFGDGSLQITVDAPIVAEQSRRFLSTLGYVGFVGVEFKRDPRDGTFRLMEINPRTVSGNQLAISSGVDFPWLVYRHLTGDASVLADVAPFRRGVRYVNEEWDFRSYLAMRREGTLTLARWLASVWGAEAFAVGSWRDPGPLLEVARRFALGALRGGSRR
jgi:predicted ATP-grasp superfamily ATP-dependent carboligase